MKPSRLTVAQVAALRYLSGRHSAAPNMVGQAIAEATGSGQSSSQGLARTAGRVCAVLLRKWLVRDIHDPNHLYRITEDGRAALKVHDDDA